MEKEEFKKSLEEAAKKFNELDKNKVIRLIGHLDADGISACALMIKILNLDSRRYSVSIVQQINDEVLNELSLCDCDYFIFVDLGSGSLEGINKALPGKKVFLLDHHIPESKEVPENIVLANPHLHGIDGGQEISGAGVVYLFCREINSRIEDYAHIALIGAIGDVQEKNGLSELNKDILKTAERKGKIKLKKGLRLFGMQTRPLHKVLEYSSDPYIPGVTGSESGAIQFLQQIGITPKNGNEWRKIVHLNDEETKKLAEGIIMKRLGEQKPDDVMGDIYLLPEEKEESALRDAKEFATLLNACGRLGKASLGIGACLGDTKTKKKAISCLADYKKEIVNAINWYNGNKEPPHVTKGEGYVIINAKDRILPTIIGTLASIISKSNELPKGTFVLSLAQMIEGNTKASLRLSGYNNEVDLNSVISEITSKVGGSIAGGHMQAAGALIPTENEEQFIDAAKDVLSKKAMEEKVN